MKFHFDSAKVPTFIVGPARRWNEVHRAPSSIRTENLRPGVARKCRISMDQLMELENIGVMIPFDHGASCISSADQEDRMRVGVGDHIPGRSEPKKRLALGALQQSDQDGSEDCI